MKPARWLSIAVWLGAVFLAACGAAPVHTPVAVLPSPEPLSVRLDTQPTLDCAVGEKTIPRNVQYRRLGDTYSLEATGEQGRIPYGVTADLRLREIVANYGITGISARNAQNIDVHVIDSCGPSEKPCDITLALEPSMQPQSFLDSEPYSFDIVLETTNGSLALSVDGLLFRPLEVSDLALPVDLEEIAAILKNDSRLKFNYNDTTKLDGSCDTGTHLGDVVEIYADYQEESPDPISAPSYTVYAPADFEIIQIDGDADRRLSMSTFVGWNTLGERIFYTLIHITRFDEPFKRDVADAAGIDPSALDIDWDNPRSMVGPLRFSAALRAERGTVIGYKQSPWEWKPGHGTHHGLGLHMNLTKNEKTDNIQPVSASIPAMTEHYINAVISYLVLEKGLVIGIEYAGEDWCNHPERILEHISPEVMEQIAINRWLVRPIHFEISRK